MANNRPTKYLQIDPKWKNVSYSTKYEYTTIGVSGCGPTAMAMAIAFWKDPSVTPVTTCKWSVDHGYKATGNGTYHSYFVPQAKAYGIDCERVNSSSFVYMSESGAEPYHKIAHDAVDDGNLVICLMGPGNWTKGGHYILWYDNDGDDILINDPASTATSRERNKFSLLKSQVRFYWILKVPEEVISMTNTDINKLIDQKAKEIADKAIADYKESMMGRLPSGDWSKDQWYAACKQGIFDGSNPRNMLTREQLAILAVRFGLIKDMKCPDGFDFEKDKF